MESQIEILEKRIALPRSKKLCVAAYIRVSSEKDEALNSLQNQELTYTAQIIANPYWALAGIYSDCGISGTLEARPEFQRLMSDCRAGKIDLIITKSFSRFARNTIVLLSALRELKSHGIEVIFENDNIRSLSAGGELLITLLAAKAQAESFSVSENQRWRIKKMFKQGLLTGGVRMLGYRSENNRLRIIPEEVPIVKQIYSDYLSGMGYIAIAKKLNKMGLHSINQRYWQRSSVRNILYNEKYTGSMLLQKTYTQDHISKKRMVNKGERRFYKVKGSHDAIIPHRIDKEVKAKILCRAKEIAPKPGQYGTNKHIFAGLIVCDKCGKHYGYKLGGATNYKKSLWICNTFNTIGKDYCNSQQIPEKILIAKTAEVLGTNDITEMIHDKIKMIHVHGKGKLLYEMLDGTFTEVHWENPSRRESWTPEMREMARQKSLAYAKGIRYER